MGEPVSPRSRTKDVLRGYTRPPRAFSGPPPNARRTAAAPEHDVCASDTQQREAPSPLGVAHKSGAASSASSAWRGLQGVSIVLRAVLEELVLDELADELAEELQQNKWSKEKLAGWLRNGSSEFSSCTLRSMIAECDSKEARLLRTLENLVPQMWKGGMFGANVWGGKFGKKAEFL